jgi:hypothetical protein
MVNSCELRVLTLSLCSLCIPLREIDLKFHAKLQRKQRSIRPSFLRILYDSVKPFPIHFIGIACFTGIPFDGAFGDRDGAKLLAILVNGEDDIRLSQFPPRKVDVDVVYRHIGSFYLLQGLKTLQASRSSFGP